MTTSLGFPEPLDTALLADCAKRDRELADAINDYLLAHEVKSGTDAIAVTTAGQPATKVITFDPPYPAGTTPKVVISLRSGSSMNAKFLAATTETPEGFTAIANWIGGTGSVAFTWHAHI